MNKKRFVINRMRMQTLVAADVGSLQQLAPSRIPSSLYNVFRYSLQMGQYLGSSSTNVK